MIGNVNPMSISNLLVNGQSGDQMHFKELFSLTQKIEASEYQKGDFTATQERPLSTVFTQLNQDYNNLLQGTLSNDVIAKILKVSQEELEDIGDRASLMLKAYQSKKKELRDQDRYPGIISLPGIKADDVLTYPKEFGFLSLSEKIHSLVSAPHSFVLVQEKAERYPPRYHSISTGSPKEEQLLRYLIAKHFRFPDSKTLPDKNLAEAINNALASHYQQQFNSGEKPLLNKLSLPIRKSEISDATYHTLQKYTAELLLKEYAIRDYSFPYEFCLLELDLP